MDPSFLDQIDAALADWDGVMALQRQGTREVFEAARALLHSPCARLQVLGADILGQLGSGTGGELAFQAETVELLRETLRREHDPAVLASACIALGHRHAPTAIPELRALKSHWNERVRYAVVFGLLTLEDEAAVETLLELTGDPSPDVRDWATFGVGTQIDTDSAEIRTALAARLDDPDPDTRGEALVGLARRGDGRALPVLLRELTEGWHGRVVAEAAELLACSEVLDALIAARGAWGEDEPLLEEAIVACQAAIAQSQVSR